MINFDFGCQPADQLAVDDVALHEAVARVTSDALEVARITGICELVQSSDAVLRDFASVMRTTSLPMNPALPVTSRRMGAS
jgi:hypothetical protein